MLSFTHEFIPGTGPDAGTTLLLLHGTGGDERDLLPLGPMLLPGAAMLSPRGRVLERGMPRFFRRLAEGVFDIPDLIARAAELAAFVREASEHYGFDASRVVAVGFSNGANIAAAVMLLHPEVLACGVLLSPMVPLREVERPDLSGRRVFLGAGRMDPIVPAREVEELALLLGEAGAEVTVHWQPGGHAITREEIDAAAEWLKG